MALELVLAGIAGEVFQCQFPSQRSDEGYIPDISDDYFGHLNASRLFLDENDLILLDDRSSGSSGGSSAQTYIYSIPTVESDSNCCGTVRAIEFCYTTAITDVAMPVDIFQLILLDSNVFLSRKVIQDTPSDTNCDRGICCTVVSEINMDIQSDYRVGIVTLSGNTQPLAHDSDDHSIMAIQTPSSPFVNNLFDPNIDLTGTLSMMQPQSFGLPLLRFFLGINHYNY